MAFIEFLEEARPEITGDTFERVALSAKELSGYERCLKRIEEATESEMVFNTKPQWVPDEDK